MGVFFFVLTIILNPLTQLLFHAWILKTSFTAELDHGVYDAILEVGPILGLLIYIFSKEKVDDERIFKIRLEPFAISFIVGAVLINVFLKVYCIGYSGWALDSVMLSQLVVYALSFEIKKRIA